MIGVIIITVVAFILSLVLVFIEGAVNTKEDKTKEKKENTEEKDK